MASFSDYTNKIVQKLPYWFKMKKDPKNSIGATFLNAFGLELEDVRYILEYAYEQTRIEDADIRYIDRAYKATLPGNVEFEDIVSIGTNQFLLKQVNDLIAFFDITYNITNNNHLYDNNVFFFDKKRHTVFVKDKYDACNHYPNGKIVVKTKTEKFDLELKTHQVWNFFDEFGLLLDCHRIEGEGNESYKNRILDVFKNIGGASKDGLLNALARELNLRKTVMWVDSSRDLVLEDQMIVVNKIKANGEYVHLDNIFINGHNQVVLKGSPEDMFVVKEISYVCGLEMHEIHNKKDKKLNYEFFYQDNKPKEALIEYVKKLHNDIPIIWGKFKWDNSYWDITDEELGGVAFIPSTHDASIRGFEKYKK